MSTFFPPCLRILKLAVKPILVKKAVIKIGWSVVSRLMVKELVRCSVRITRAKTKPPTTDGGMQYFVNKVNLFLRYLPI